MHGQVNVLDLWSGRYYIRHGFNWEKTLILCTTPIFFTRIWLCLVPLFIAAAVGVGARTDFLSISSWCESIKYIFILLILIDSLSSDVELFFKSSRSSQIYIFFHFLFIVDSLVFFHIVCINQEKTFSNIVVLYHYVWSSIIKQTNGKDIRKPIVYFKTEKKDTGVLELSILLDLQLFLSCTRVWEINPWCPYMRYMIYDWISWQFWEAPTTWHNSLSYQIFGAANLVPIVPQHEIMLRVHEMLFLAHRNPLIG